MSTRERPRRGPTRLRGGADQVIVRIGSAVVAAVSAPIVARYLGPAGFGVYTLVLVVSGFVVTIGEFGFGSLASRELAGTSRHHEAAWLRKFWTLRLLTSLVLMAAAVGVVVLIPVGQQLRVPLLVALAAIPVSHLAAAGMGVLTAKLRLRDAARAELVGRLASLAGIGAAVGLGLGVPGVVLAVSLGQLAIILALARPLRGSLGPLLPRTDLARGSPSFRSLGRRAGFLVLLPFVGLLYSRVDVVGLALLRTTAEVGAYGVAWRVLEVLLSVGAVATAAMVPLIVRQTSSARATPTYLLFLRLVTIGFLLAAGLIGGAADLVIRALGGPAFLRAFPTLWGSVDAVVSLRILMVAAVLMAVGSVNGAFLIARRRNTELAQHFGISLTANVVLTALLIPVGSLVGAAVATLGSELVATANSNRLVRRELTFSFPFRQLSGPAAAAGSALGAGWLFTSGTWWTGATAALVALVGMSWLTGVGRTVRTLWDELTGDDPVPQGAM